MKGKERFSRLAATVAVIGTIGGCGREADVLLPNLEPKSNPVLVITPDIFKEQRQGLVLPTVNSTKQPEEPVRLSPTPKLTSIPIPTPTKEPTKIVDPLVFEGINFRDRLDTRITIRVVEEEELKINFRPRVYENNGEDISEFCAPGKDVCALSVQGKNILLLTHSGYRSITGQRLESESLRQYIEGRGRKILPEEERQARLESLIGAEVDLQQGCSNLAGEIVSAVRLSPEEAENLIHLEVFGLALKNQLEDQRFLALIFCGWQDENEEPAADSTRYTWSRYILLIKSQE